MGNAISPVTAPLIYGPQGQNGCLKGKRWTPQTQTADSKARQLSHLAEAGQDEKGVPRAPQGPFTRERRGLLEVGSSPIPGLTLKCPRLRSSGGGHSGTCER